MKVAVGIPVLHNFEGCVKLIESLNGEHFTPYIQNNWDENIGVAAAWNIFLDKAIQDQIDLLIISNDDIVFNPGSFSSIKNAWLNKPDDCILMGTSTDGSVEFTKESVAYFCFALNPADALREIGYFDQKNFIPAYFEDDDYSYRIKLSQYSEYGYRGFFVEHAGSVTQFWNGEEDRVVSHEQFEANRNRYIEKWGGRPGEETYRSPYKK